MLDESFLDLERAHVSNIKIAIMTIASQNLKLLWFVFALDFQHSILPSPLQSAHICTNLRFYFPCWCVIRRFVRVFWCFACSYCGYRNIHSNDPRMSTNQPTSTYQIHTTGTNSRVFLGLCSGTQTNTEREYEHHTWSCHSMRGAYASEDLQSTVPLVWCASSWGVLGRRRAYVEYLRSGELLGALIIHVWEHASLEIVLSGEL